MNLIERLKQLEADTCEYEGCYDFEEHMQVFQAEVVAVLPKLLAVVEAAEDVHLLVTPNDDAASDKLSKLQYALAALEEDV